jgi:hypothetical protein
VVLGELLLFSIPEPSVYCEPTGFLVEGFTAFSVATQGSQQNWGFGSIMNDPSVGSNSFEDLT